MQPKPRRIHASILLAAAILSLPGAMASFAPARVDAAPAPPGAALSDPLATGIAKYKQQKYAEAIQSLNVFLTRNAASPSASTAYYYMACCYYQAGRIEDAKRLYETVARSYPRSAEAPISNDMLTRLAVATAAGNTSRSDPSGTATAHGNATLATAGGSSVSGRMSPVSPLKSAGATALADTTADTDETPAEKARYEAEYAALPHSSRVQFTRDEGGHMYVTVWVNNHPIKAIFDTGAHAHFGLNHLAQVGVSVPANAERSYTSGWAGKPVPIWVMDADLKLGEVKRRVPITVEENMTLPPLVGQEFLKEMRYEIDDKGGVMTLSKARSSKTDSAYSSIYDVPCLHVNGDDVIPVMIQGRKASAIIDTGAQITIFSPDTLKGLGIDIPPDAPVTSIGGVGGSLRCNIVELDLQVGPVRKQNFRTFVGGNAGNAIGQDFLQGWRYTVDQERHLMRFFH